MDRVTDLALKLETLLISESFPHYSALFVHIHKIGFVVHFCLKTNAAKGLS